MNTTPTPIRHSPDDFEGVYLFDATGAFFCEAASPAKSAEILEAANQREALLSRADELLKLQTLFRRKGKTLPTAEQIYDRAVTMTREHDALQKYFYEHHKASRP